MTLLNCFSDAPAGQAASTRVSASWYKPSIFSPM
jgi:hypothetical protein